MKRAKNNITKSLLQKNQHPNIHTHNASQSSVLSPTADIYTNPLNAGLFSLNTPKSHLLFKTVRICLFIDGEWKFEWQTGWISNQSPNSSCCLHNHYILVPAQRGLKCWAFYNSAKEILKFQTKSGTTDAYTVIEKKYQCLHTRPVIFIHNC